jgi:hypothetical protein
MLLSISQASLANLFLNLALGLAMSLVLSWYYVRFGRSLANRTLLAATLPVLTLVTLMLIADSRAATGLKLGVLSALAIVRFRTAIRDPEEILFLLIAIVIGLGLSIGQQIPVLAGFVVIMAILLARNFHKQAGRYSHNLYLSIDLENEQAEDRILEEVNRTLHRDLSKLNLQRKEKQGSALRMTYNLAIGDQKTLMAVMDNLKLTFPDGSISLVQRNHPLAHMS